MGEWVSNCCSASPWIDMDYGICGDCKEHCEFINLDEWEE